VNGPPTRARPCLVLIAGTLCDARVFTRQVRHLRSLAHVVVFDSTRLRDPTAWLAAQTKALPARFSVAGFSLGGLWALELLRVMPERIERLALIASNADAGSRQVRQRS
jgi:pimeloyl-ACP methyl ester carboxylesterase